MNEILNGALAGFAAIFINYIIGKPGSEFSPYEIFSGYTIWLSKKRLQQLGLYNEYKKEQADFETCESGWQLYERRKDFARILYNAAESFFTWERAFGMCAICTGFWIALIWGICIYGLSYFSLIKIIVVSHVTIRLLAKIL